MVCRVCVQRYGYVAVSGKNEAEILEKVKELDESDFDWESARDFTSEASIVEKLGDDDIDPEPGDNEGDTSKVMVYTSPRGKIIVFDDWEDNTEEFHSYWSEMCPRCHNKFRGILGKRVSVGAMGTCSVQGCENEAMYYVDFDVKEVGFQPDASGDCEQEG